jgi:hypothetical protein
LVRPHSSVFRDWLSNHVPFKEGYRKKPHNSSATLKSRINSCNTIS